MRKLFLANNFIVFADESYFNFLVLVNHFDVLLYAKGHKMKTMDTKRLTSALYMKI